MFNYKFLSIRIKWRLKRKNLFQNNIKIRSNRVAPLETCSICLEIISEKFVYLNCQHCFHEKCIKTFESFNREKLVNTCPVCRSAYTRVDFDV